jgi:hypothetical protein
MPSMSREQILEFRRKLAERMILLQNETLVAHDKASVIPNMIAGLLSLASFIARKNANMSRADLERVAEAAINEQYERDLRKFDRWAG